METLISIGLLQLVAVISPGPSFLITARTAVAHSRWDGVKIALGLGAGTVIWAGAALLGLQGLFQQFDWLYFGMKIFGALFILWIAYQVIRHAAEPLALDDADGTDTIRPFTQGFMTQISNPKVVVFFGSIFIALVPSEMPLWMAFALIAIVSFNEIWWYSIVALFFGLRPVKNFYIHAKAWIDRVTGSFLGLVGLRLLWGAFR
jgi:hypothetical protein